MQFLRKTIFHLCLKKKYIFGKKEIPSLQILQKSSYSSAIFFGNTIFSEHLEKENMVFRLLLQWVCSVIFLYFFMIKANVFNLIITKKTRFFQEFKITCSCLRNHLIICLLDFSRRYRKFRNIRQFWYNLCTCLVNAVLLRYLCQKLYSSIYFYPQTSTLLFQSVIPSQNLLHFKQDHFYIVFEFCLLQNL